jgi:hypothetical protein
MLTPLDDFFPQPDKIAFCQQPFDTGCSRQLPKMLVQSQLGCRFDHEVGADAQSRQSSSFVLQPAIVGNYQQARPPDRR